MWYSIRDPLLWHDELRKPFHKCITCSKFTGVWAHHQPHVAREIIHDKQNVFLALVTSTHRSKLKMNQLVRLKGMQGMTKRSCNHASRGHGTTHSGSEYKQCKEEVTNSLKRIAKSFTDLEFTKHPSTFVEPHHSWSIHLLPMPCTLPPQIWFPDVSDNQTLHCLKGKLELELMRWRILQRSPSVCSWA